MNRPSKKDIKAALEKLHKPQEENGVPMDYHSTPLEKKNKSASQKPIRKKGV